MRKGSGMKKVEEVVKGWSPEERERFKDLIDECVKREIQIEENRIESLKGLKEIVDAKLAEQAANFHIKEGTA